MHLLLCGVSARAAAASAAHAGFAVTSLDAFADLDRHPLVRALSLPRDYGVPYSAAATVRAARDLAFDAVAYTSPFENHPAALQALAHGRRLLGNPPDVLRRVRRPWLVADALRAHGLPAPENRVEASSLGPTAAASSRDETARSGDRPSPAWLVKPLRSGGGRGIRPWDGSPPPRGCYVQRLIPGMPGSLVFVAARGRAVPLGLSLQLVGERAFGASGYRYCGSILVPEGDVFPRRVEDLAVRAARLVAADFNLTGVNGIDFVSCGDTPVVVEVNPRWSSSMELVERAYGLTLFHAHAAACLDGVLPGFDLSQARSGARAYGKAVVFARADAALGDTTRWLEDGTVHDVPRPGERIRRGDPVCTVFATGESAADCRAALAARAEAVYRELEPWLERQEPGPLSLDDEP